MTPRTAEQFAALREESRERILEAALSLFARHGYERTSIRMIAREAGISQGLTYNYFRGKEDLLRAIFERGMEDVRESFRRAPPGASPHGRLEALIRASLEIVRENEDFWRLSYSLRMQPAVLRGLAGEVRGWAESIRSEIEGLLRAAGEEEPAIGAEVLFGLIDGVAQHYVLEPDRYPLGAVADAIVARYAAPDPKSPERRATP